jgi:hypothetical protein
MKSLRRRTVSKFTTRTEICEDIPYELIEADMDAAIEKFERDRQ